MGLVVVTGCSKPPEEPDSSKPMTTDGKPVPPEAMRAPAAPGGFDGAGPPKKGGNQKP
jgi:hypothetical protein